MKGKKRINEIIERIVKTSNPLKIILFGSYVYGVPKEESDIDFLVVKPNIKSKIDEYTKIMKGLKGFKLPIDIIVITPEEYNFYSQNWKNSVISEADEMGLVLYGK